MKVTHETVALNCRDLIRIEGSVGAILFWLSRFKRPHTKAKVQIVFTWKDRGVGHGVSVRIISGESTARPMTQGTVDTISTKDLVELLYEKTANYLMGGGLYFVTMFEPDRKQRRRVLELT